jgi:hypothetical protein
MSDMENREWINEFEALKKVSPGNPFAVPAGYFENLADRIMSVKNLDELKNSQPLNGFSVPADYFNELTSNIQSRVALENYKGNEDFSIPENYFDELANNIGARIALEGFKEQEESFSVPEGYFETLAQQIQSRIAIEETVGAPAEYLAVPDGYFNKLSGNILNKTVNSQRRATKKPKGVVRKLFASTAFKYATAACFAVAIGAGILISKLTDPAYVHNHSFLHQQLSTIPVEELKNYLDMGVDAGETQHMILTNGAAIDSVKLKNDLQDYLDSVQ